jgi:hypothetical protein
MWVRISPPGEEWAACCFVTSLSPSAVALFLEERELGGQSLEGKGALGFISTEARLSRVRSTCGAPSKTIKDNHGENMPLSDNRCECS